MKLRVVSSLFKASPFNNFAFDGQMPGSYTLVFVGKLDRYKKAYRNEMRNSGDHSTAHIAAMGQVEKAIDDTKRSLSFGSTLETVIAQKDKSGDFVDPSFTLCTTR